MAFQYWSRVFCALSRCGSQVSQQVNTIFRLWQGAHDEPFTLPRGMFQIISWYTSMSPNLISPCDDDSTHSICIMKCIMVVFEYPYGLIWSMIVIIPRWFMILNLLIRDHQYLASELSQVGYASSWVWIHVVEIRSQWIISWITMTTIIIYRRNLE